MPDLAILIVCSGNIIRSPLAQLMLQANLAVGADYQIGSAGTQGGAGDPMTEQGAALARRYGLDPTQHSARFLTEQLVADADLLLGMTRNHRRAIVELDPRKISATFTFLEFARIAATIESHDVAALVESSKTSRERLLSLVRLVARKRTLVEGPNDPNADDVIDPYHRDAAIYSLAGRQIAEGVAEVTRILKLAEQNTRVHLGEQGRNVGSKT